MEEQRLINIETKLAYQEKFIKELNDIICDQQKEIDRLGLICRNLIEQNKELAKSNAPANEKPPHY